MVRNVTQMGEGWVIGFTPTYSGCPATEHLIGAIREAMTTHGFTPVQVVLQLDPAWTTDWMTPDARERLRQYGVRPPAEQLPCPFAARSTLPALRQRPYHTYQSIWFHGLQSIVSLR